MSAVINSYTDVDALSKAESKPDYDALMTQYAPMVKRVAYHMMGRLPATIQLEDMVQVGMIGLFEALKAYDTSKGASFETYARIRIQGAMLDEVRRGDWTPRSVYKKSRQLSEAITKVEREKGGHASDSEVAAELQMDMDEYYSLVEDAAGCQLVSYEDIVQNDHGRNESSASTRQEPFQHLENDDFKQALVNRISGLPERERLVMSLYYDEEFNLREIGEIIGVSEGRVCQIHSQALLRLKSRMADWTGQDSD